MSKKDFETVAAAIKEQVEWCHRNKALGVTSADAILVALRDLAEDLSHRFAEENPRFNENIFLTACGF